MEKFNITVEGQNGSKFRLKFLNPKYDPNNRNSVQLWGTGVITDTGSIWHYRQQMVSFFSRIWGTNISIEQTRFDADDLETDDADLTVKSVYTVTLLRQINGPSFTMAMVVPEDGATSTMTIDIPYQQSTPPMSGKYKIMCPNEDGNPFYTREFNYNTEAQYVDFYTQLEIPHLQFKTYMRSTGKYPYSQSGVSLQIYFSDYHGEVPQCEIMSGENDPIVATDPTYDVEYVREYGDNLIFEPVPLEFLYADA